MAGGNNSVKHKITDICDKNIYELSYTKTQFIKARNYYSGFRDPEQFRSLEENYGLGNPTTLKFIPLIKLHVDELVGEYLSAPKLQYITCRDKTTINNINDERAQKVNDSFISNTKDMIDKMLFGKANLDEDKLLSSYNNDGFISNYEITAQNILTWATQDYQLDYIRKVSNLFSNACIYGYMAYRILPTSNMKSIDFTVPSPIFTFTDRNNTSPYFNKCDRMVIQDYMTKTQILAKFGDKISDEDLKRLDDQDPLMRGGEGYIFTTATEMPETQSGILGGMEAGVFDPFARESAISNNVLSKYFVVYDCEWIEIERKGGQFVKYRHRCVKIGEYIYIDYGRVDYAFRDIDNPNECSLSLNGCIVSDGDNQPSSLILKTADLQDKFDIVNFFEDLTIYSSGAKGDWLDVAHIPAFLGDSFEERIVRWIGYKKNGLGLYDTSEDGNPMLNTSFNGYDDTVSPNAIQAFEVVKNYIKATCSDITGVFKEKVGGIEQRDAVSNTQAGMKQSTLVTKGLFHMLSLMTRAINIDILNMCRYVYPKGLTGSFVLGGKSKTFEALPKYYSVTSFDINIMDQDKADEDRNFIKQFSLELVKSAQASPLLAIKAATSNSLTEMKQSMEEAISKQSNVEQTMQQYKQQLEQQAEQIKQYEEQIKNLGKKNDQLNESKIQLDRDKLEYEKNLNMYKAKTDADYKAQDTDLKKKEVQLEGAELVDNNNKNDLVKNL